MRSALRAPLRLFPPLRGGLSLARDDPSDLKASSSQVPLQTRSRCHVFFAASDHLRA
jgi:hypothetical protein